MAAAAGEWFATEYHPLQAGSIDGTDVAPHDHAVARASRALKANRYDPKRDSNVRGDPLKTIFVGRLSERTTEAQIEQVFSQHGRIRSVNLVRDIVTGASRGYSFVEFEHKADMLDAYRSVEAKWVDGRRVLVDYSRAQLMPGWLPRRFGGGLGGRKESGQLRFGGRDRPFKAPLKEFPAAELAKHGIKPPPPPRLLRRGEAPPLPTLYHEDEHLHDSRRALEPSQKRWREEDVRYDHHGHRRKR
eukprot:jgi/Chlat1/2277/Chrsp17S02579